MKSPDVSTAQILAVLTFVAGQAVAFGWLDQGREQLVVSVGSIVIGAVWKIADAIIRNGRAQVAAAKVAADGQLATTVAPLAKSPKKR